MTHEIDPVSRLAHHPTSVISDALDELGIAGVLAGVRAQRVGQGRIAGRALPVRFVRKSNDPASYRFGGGVGKPLEQVLKTMRAGDVVIMDLDGANDAAAWGGLASRIAQQRGVRGTVMWGSCRDVEEIRAVGYPVWAVATCPRRSRNSFTFGSINETIVIGSVTIAPGDFVLADESGVVVVPAARIEEVLALAERIDAQEQLLESQIRNATLTSWDAV